jgi:hypothetical protein
MSIEEAIKFWEHMLDEIQKGVDEFYFWTEDLQDELADALNVALAAIGAQQEAATKPLALDELLKMNGEPVWVEDLQVKTLSSYGIVVIDEEPYSYVTVPLGNIPLQNYGKTWLAYRRKPNEDLESK